jgi:lysophospholipase L1-like esterase
MHYQNVELHNVAETTPYRGGVALQRVPETVRRQLNPGAQLRMLQPASCEIRFALDPGDTAEVTLSVAARPDLEDTCQVTVFFGDYRHDIRLVGTDPVTIPVAWSDTFLRFRDAVADRPHAFAPHVVRLMPRGGQVVLHGVTGASVRPPRPAELPALRYLAYGTSITHGAAASAPHLPYVVQTARRLGADLLNVGVGGSCHAEAALADYFAGRADWQIASLALSVNMMGFEPAEFETRVRYMVHTVAGSNPERPVACITLYPYFGDLGAQDLHRPEKAARFREILRAAVRDCPTPNAHLVEGPDLLRTFTGLTTDLIHPADDGMIEMGLHLAAALRKLL